MIEKLIKVEELAKLLDMSTARVYQLVRENMIPSCKFGRQLRFSKKAIYEFIENGGKQYPGGWKKKSDNL